MSDRQKQMILKWLISLGIVISVGLSITWLVLILENVSNIKEQLREVINWLVANFGSMTLGLVLKYLMNKRHLKDIKTIMEGKEMKKIENKLYRGFSIIVNKHGELVIKDTLNRSGLDVINALNDAMLEYTEDIRKAL